MENYQTTMRIVSKNPYLRVGVLSVFGLTVAETPETFQQEIKTLISSLQQKEESLSDNNKKAIRDLLRFGGYKPAGRGRPSSEYLSKTALQGTFPFINNVVDINNLISLKYGVPICLLDLDITGPHLIIREGSEHESYVFNQSGHIIKLDGLLTICSVTSETDEVGIPLGNPVKDSMHAKLTGSSQNAVGIVFSHKEVLQYEDLEHIMNEFAVKCSDIADPHSYNYKLYETD